MAIADVPGVKLFAVTMYARLRPGATQATAPDRLFVPVWYKSAPSNPLRVPLNHPIA